MTTDDVKDDLKKGDTLLKMFDKINISFDSGESASKYFSFAALYCKKRRLRKRSLDFMNVLCK